MEFLLENRKKQMLEIHSEFFKNSSKFQLSMLQLLYELQIIYFTETEGEKKIGEKLIFLFFSQSDPISKMQLPKKVNLFLSTCMTSNMRQLTFLFHLANEVD